MYTWSATNFLIFSSVTSLHGYVPLTVCWLFESMHPRILICVVAYLSDDFWGEKQHEDAAAAAHRSVGSKSTPRRLRGENCALSAAGAKCSRPNEVNTLRIRAVIFRTHRIRLHRRTAAIKRPEEKTKLTGGCSGEV